MRSYFSFNKAERAGFAGLLIIILIVVSIRIILPMYVPAKIVVIKTLPDRLQKARMPNPAQKGEMATGQATGNGSDIAKAELFYFDPNELDSAGFRKLGLREKTTSLLLNWRRKGKVFRKKEELKSLYTLTGEEYMQLAPYIRIKSKLIDLNLADSVALLRLTGIGPKLAHKIIAYREENGKFTYIEQLFEIHRFADSTFSQLKKEVYIVETRAN